MIRDYQSNLPKIQEVFRCRTGFDWVSTLDLTSQFYHFVLAKFARKVYIINTPFGLYRFNRMLMGLKVAPGFVTSLLTWMFAPMPGVEVFIDNIAIFTRGTFQDHVRTIRQVLKVLNENDFLIKPKKCAWGRTAVP